MKLRPRLVKSTMLLTFGFAVKNDVGIEQQIEQGKRLVDVELWERIGLCISEYHDGSGWRISHVESGRSILKNMRSREQCIDYLMKINEMKVNWHVTQRQFDQSPRREGIVKALNVLQREISGERR